MGHKIHRPSAPFVPSLRHSSQSQSLLQPFRGRGASSSGASFSRTPGFSSGFTAQTPHVHDHYPQSRARSVSRNPASVAPATTEPCRKFNQGRCNFVGCRRPHVCTTCGASHPVFRCPSQSTWPGPATESDLLPTPLKVGRWRSLLASHPLPAFAVYVTLGWSKGFRIGYEGPRNILQRATNLVSATVHSAIISEHLSACVAKGEISGPFANPPFPNFMSSGAPWARLSLGKKPTSVTPSVSAQFTPPTITC